MNRLDGRQPTELRRVKLHPHYLDQPAGSVLIEMGNTRVLCAASVEEAVPRWMRDQKIKGGWITAEYSMLPYATPDRKQREISRGKLEGRTQEIQRLIGRALRAVVNLEKLGDRTVWLDCDVLQADGGTRTASITGAYVALMLAVNKLKKDGKLAENPVETSVAAISVGIVDGQAVLDLNYEEDVRAEVDMNVVMTGTGKFVEVQGTAEDQPFSSRDLSRMLKLAATGIEELIGVQQKIVG
jgi:ribonuclease PH